MSPPLSLAHSETFTIPKTQCTAIHQCPFPCVLNIHTIIVLARELTNPQTIHCNELSNYLHIQYPTQVMKFSALCLRIIGLSGTSATVTPVSASGVAASILEDENNKGSSRTAAAKKQGVECTLANTANVQKSAADADVLSSCRVGEVCVEDSTSKIGGRCELVASASDEAAALEPLRDLQDCEKCSGMLACRGVFYKSKIGCGSCIGYSACSNIPSVVTIGNNSCSGVYACSDGRGEWNIVTVR